jgi:deoxyribonuclease-1
MARRASTRSRRANSPGLPRRLGKALRGVAVSLALITALSYLPTSLVDDHPNARKAIEIAGEIRDLTLAVISDSAETGSDWLAWGARLVQKQFPSLVAWLPELDLVGSGPDSPTGDLPDTPDSFATTKRLLYQEVYRGHRLTFYCRCPFDGDRDTVLGPCGLSAYRGETRANRVEAEHVFPAWQFGNFRKCWRKPESFPECREPDGDVYSGRDCCQRVDPIFEAAHNDLHNLVPAVGLINGQRSNHNWGMVPSGETYGACQIRIDSSIRRVEPPAAVRGDIARTMLYMRDTYGFRLSRQDEQLYVGWNNSDPPDRWERIRNHRIAVIEGNENPYISDYRRLQR